MLVSWWRSGAVDVGGEGGVGWERADVVGSMRAVGSGLSCLRVIAGRTGLVGWRSELGACGAW